MRIRLPLSAALSAAVFVAPQAARAQAWYYPSFQIPTTVGRDYTFAAAGGGGTAFVFQWREALDAINQLSLDAGLADAEGPSNTKLFVGGQYARQLTRAQADQPLDLLLTAGAGVAFGDGPDVFRIPVGVSIGHRFPLEGELAVTPYVHPRVSLDTYTGGDGAYADRTKLALDFDLGGNLELTRTLAVRATFRFSGDAPSETGFGVGLTYTPSSLRR